MGKYANLLFINFLEGEGGRKDATSVCMCVHMYIRIFVCMYLYVDMCVCVHMYIRMYVYMYIYVHACMYV